jgi:serine/threonine protein kinase
MRYSLITPKKNSSVPIDLVDQIGRGATAKVFNFTNNSQQYAAKIYKNPENIDWDKITQMTEYSYDPSFSFTKKHAWPIGIIQENGTNVGFAMPLFDTENFLSLDHFYDNILKSSVKDKDLLTLPNLGLLCKNLANVMAEFHKHKIFLIDVKPQNIAVNLENNEVILLDCDGFSIPSINGLRFPGNFVSIDYIAPEVTLNKIPPNKLGKKQDLYALAVLIFQILNSGIHPFSGQLNAKTLEINTNDDKAAAGLFAYGKPQNRRIKPHKSSRHKFWPESIKTAFNKTFVEGKRLSAMAWAKVFSDIEDRKDYAKCDKFPNEASHISFKNKGCIQCFIISFEDVTRAPRPKPINPQYVKPRQKPHNDSGGKIFAWIVICIFALFILNEVFVSNSKKPLITSPSILQQDSIKTCNDTASGIKICSDVRVCNLATTQNSTGDKIFDNRNQYKNYVSEAKRRNLGCGVKKKVVKKCDSTTFGVKNCSDVRVCNMATRRNSNNAFVFDNRSQYKNYVSEAKRRNLGCGVKKKVVKTCNDTASGIKVCSDVRVCNLATTQNSTGDKIFDNRSQYKNYVFEAKRRNLGCGVKKKVVKTCDSTTFGVKNCSDVRICNYATRRNSNDAFVFETDSQYKNYVSEAKRRNLSCIVKKQVVKNCDATALGVKNCSDIRICVLATIQKPNGEKVFDNRKNYKNYVSEAKRRNLECENKKQISNICNSTVSGVKNCSNSFICTQSTELVLEYGKYEKKFYEDPSNLYLNEAKFRNLKCGVKEKLNSGICSIEGGLGNCSDTMICWNATFETYDNKILFNSDSFSKPYIEEVKRRNLNCGVTK